ncbi:PREDICTED: testis-expressed sequence 15 protein isoform X2 [Chinchilla lanigera]|uniref:testis-expressed sequence 15 protein isoform X2 n=1 Tax=Chinchilla lanigera TaxID=34839 RepID=UPI00038ECB2E|nr:PREDICTED: testis-expressed sequence 15 protein isoform X2 [Chinchilla lanigera]
MPEWVLFGKVKKIQPSMDVNKVSLDPCPNFDCHMSRSVPSLKDTVELQAYNSVVYFYEYNILSKPVDKPRQCLPYAVVTVKFIGQKIDIGHLTTPLRLLATGFPKRLERTCSLNNCTVAKRIGKGKDATVIFEHFGKPVDPFAPENCSCSTQNSEINSFNADISNSYENVQSGNTSILETNSGQSENNLAEIRGTSQGQVYDSGPPFMPNDNKESGNSDHVFLTYLKDILNVMSAPFPPHNNTGSSTVTTSKFIKDPRLMKKEESMGKQNHATGLSEILPFEKNLVDNAEINPSYVLTNSSYSSEVIPHDCAAPSNCLDTTSSKFSFDDSPSQTHNLGPKDYNCIAPRIRQYKDQGNFSFPVSLLNVSELENQKHSEDKAQTAQERNGIPLLIKQSSRPHNSYESVNTYTKDSGGHISEELHSSNFNTVYQTGHQMSIVFPPQRKGSIDECIQNTGKMRNFTDPEDSYGYDGKRSLQKETDNNFTNETKITPISNYISSCQEYKNDKTFDSLGGNTDEMLITQELEMPEPPNFTTKDDEQDHLALELESNLTLECLSQKHPQHSIDCEVSMHTSFVSTQKLREMNLEKTNQNCVSIRTDAFQEAKDILQTRELLGNSVTKCHGVEIALDNSNCSKTREYVCVQRKNENKSVSLEDIQRDCTETPYTEDEGQAHILSGTAQLNDDKFLSIHFKGPRDDDKENKNKAKEASRASSPANNIETVCGNQKQEYHTNNTLTNTEDRKKNKNDNREDISNSEDVSTTFNFIWREKDRSPETTLHSADTLAAMKQRDVQNTGRNVAHLALTPFPESAGSSVAVASDPAIELANTTLPTEAHPRYQLKETHSSKSPDFGLLVKQSIADCEIGMDKNKLQDSCHQPVNENSVLQSFDVASETEVELEEYDDAFLLQQKRHSHEDILHEEHEALKSRINWEGLFGSNNGKMDNLGSTTTEDIAEHHSKNTVTFCSSYQKLYPVLLPDLQVRITNTFRTTFSPPDDTLSVKNNFYRCLTEATKPGRNKEGKAPGFEIYSKSSCGNSGYPCDSQAGNSMQDSRLVSKSEISHFSNLNHNTDKNDMSGKKSNESFSTEPFNVTTINGDHQCFFTKSKMDFNDTRNKKDMESRISQRNIRTSFKDHNISHKDTRQHEICEKKRRLSSHDSSECFSSLSQGRMKIFSQSERHIKDVLDILNSETSLCKSRCLSRKLNRAVLHLKKAHRRVQTSLQLIAKVGEKRKGPLPKAYEITCNNFWESCDLQGCSSVSERRYSKHFLSKRKYDRLGKRASGSVGMSKHKSYKRNREKIAVCHSKKSVTSNVSRSHTTVHVREFCDEHHHPQSQLSLFSVSQSTSEPEYGKSSMKDSRSSECEPFSENTKYLLYSNEKQSEKENQVNTKLSNISKCEKLRNQSAHNKYMGKKNNSEVNKVISKSSSVSLSKTKENNVSYSTEKNYDAICLAHTKVKTDIFISTLGSNVKLFLNVDTYKGDNSIISDCQSNLKENFPIERWIAPTESYKPSIITGNVLMGPFNITLTSNKKYNILQLSATPVTDSERESLKSCLGKQRVLAIDYPATPTTVSHRQQIHGRKVLLKTQQSLSSSSFMEGNKTNVTEHSELDLTSVTEEMKSYGENTLKKLSFNDNSLHIKDNIKDLSEIYIEKQDIQNRKIRKNEQAEKAKGSLHKKSMSEGSVVETEYKNQKNKILKEKSPHLNTKTVKSNLIDSHLSIKTTPEAVSLSNTVSSQLNKSKKEEKTKISSDCQSGCISKPGIVEIDHMPILHAHSETSKITGIQRPTSYVNELKEKYCPVTHRALITELSQILQRADEASSLEILKEETKVCQNILPLFVEAFERKQECSLEQILISRELLVEQNLWNNCKYKLKPCAIETLVELQMVMETIQFIENKKRLLEGEPTFRSLLWYDETLYSELLGRPHGYQLQSSFYPAFQGRLKYNAFCELQNYHNQLIELFAETKRESNSYYALLKYRRQINECEAVMKQRSDCFDFSLSVPFTCGVNFGDSLADLEILRKSTLKLISIYGDSPTVHSYPGKQDHLWIIIEMISSKVNFIKSNEAVNIKVSLYGLEHICFDAAKNLVWKKKRQSFSKKYSPKNQEVIHKMNERALSKLQKIYDSLSEKSNNIPTSNIELKGDTAITSRKSDNLITIEKSTLVSRPGISISEILDQVEFADLKKLQDLTLICTDHLEILKKYFQMLQENNVDDIFITEENVLDVLKNHKHEAVILKPEATETYIEIAMLSETVHFLKNSMAKKVDNQRFRGMLWFDLSLLPQLVHCQEKMVCFSFLEDNPRDCLRKAIETGISECKKDLDIIYKNKEAVNCLYALHLFSRELKELSEIKKLLKKSEYPFPTYIDFVPCIISINYGNTVTELDHNYSQFSTLLKNTVAVPQKDLGKIAHIMKVMKTIEHMKMICAKNAKLTTTFILCQMLHNKRSNFQFKRKEKVNTLSTIPEENTRPSTSAKVPSTSVHIIRDISNSSKRRPSALDKYEDSICKKRKVDISHTAEINKEKAVFRCLRTTGFHPQGENKIGWRSSDNLKRNCVSSERDEMQGSLCDSLSPLKNSQATYTSESESKIDLTNISPDASKHLSEQQENLNSIKKRNANFGAPETKSYKNDYATFATCDQRSINGTLSKDQDTPSQKLLKNLPDPAQKTFLSNIKPATDDSLVPNLSVLSEPISHSLRDIHTNLGINGIVLDHQDNELLESSINKSTCASFPEPIYIQSRIPDTLSPSPIPFGASGSLPCDVNQTAEYSFSEWDEENPKVLTQKAATYWNELPQSTYTPVYNSSDHSLGTPYYAWCIYHYSSSSGNATAHTYQGITSYEVQSPPSGILTTLTSTVQTTPSNLVYSQYFSYFADQPQANTFVPVNGYFQSQMPISYFQQPIVSQHASHQPLSQAVYHYYPAPAVLPEASWIYAPWQQQPFQPRH